VKEKISVVKLVVIFVILGLLGVLSALGMGAAKTYLAGAAAGCEPTGGSMKVAAEDKSALLSWKTDKECLSVVEYGTNSTATLLRAAETQASKNHQITLSPLKSDIVYYFRVRVGGDEYLNETIPWSFKTKAAAAVAGGEAGTQELAPTSVPVSSGGIDSCVRGDFVKAFGSGDIAYDLDKDGKVDQKDWVKCLQDYGASSSSSVSPTAAAVSAGGDLCEKIKAAVGTVNAEYDLNKDGVVNTADWVKCKQG